MDKKIKITMVIMLSFCVLSYLYLFCSIYLAKVKMDKDFERFNKEIEKTVYIERDVSPIPYDDLGIYTISHYCDCPICTGTQKGSRTASGTKPKEGRTIACDGKILKMGDIVYIETIGLRICEDRGGAIKSNRIDLFISDHEKAKKLGIKKVRVYKLL